MSFRFRVRACGHRQVSSKFITGEICVFALIDGGDESYSTLLIINNNMKSHYETHTTAE
ncbi:hypothetical protein SAMN02745671_00965 [Anaerovibrio lipolyticus DSM 3074]|uniref:Uncharacterized protein n=1 Tax=Anaerovibrio lipolyticus DSM 3074 TaxID=1120997 RepID=A0A1M6C2I2_9FIRM|nr:hypothetical protein SAMN02745671_00965 [Anaerovibrio lipolyticus DSM 3074]